MLRKSLVPCVAVAALSLLLVNVHQASAQNRRGGMGMRGPQGVDDIAIAHNAAVEKEIGIKPDQKEKIDDLFKDVQEEVQSAMASSGIDFASLRDLPQEERAKKMGEVMAKAAEVRKGVNEKFLPKLKDALDATQLKRVHEIAIQAAGAQALLDGGVQNELKVTPEQKDKLTSISKDVQKQLAGLRGAERMTKMQELNEEQLAKSNEVLTKDQQAQFASMKGKPFDVKLLRPAGGGRRARASAGGDSK
ncbi:MAG TPA: hypothetical protein VGP76_27660 [Planctomycetaceae bacterium]|jgi:Spy/CpxP family protein refolding chaperone|nr:hypothetical protein [Planctomycetaceae bacterium]